MVRYSLSIAMRINKQLFAGINTFCSNCRKKLSMKITDGDTGDYTIMCDCGCQVFKWHPADQFHETEFYTRLFIPKNKFSKKFRNSDSLEKLGFEKTVVEGVVKYAK